MSRIFPTATRPRPRPCGRATPPCSNPAVPAGLLAALLILAAAPARAATIEYLYVDASEGGGSGGHAGLVLGDRVFHFEHRAPGLLHLARESLDRVRRRYTV